MTAKIRLISTGVIATLVVTGCAMPSQPQALPADFVPPAVEREHDPSSDVLTAEGFELSNQMTLRVRNVGCGQVITGTAFAINEDTFLTNRHVVENASQIELSMYDNQSIEVKEVLVTDVTDIAVIRTEGYEGTIPSLSDKEPEPGQQISVVGYPLGNAITTSDGVVIGSIDTDPTGTYDTGVFAADVDIEHGNSGSAVLDEDGNVVGVIYAKNDFGQAFFIPISTVQSLIDNIDQFEAASTCRLPELPETVAPVPTLDPDDQPEPIPTEDPEDEDDESGDQNSAGIDSTR